MSPSSTVRFIVKCTGRAIQNSTQTTKVYASLQVRQCNKTVSYLSFFIVYRASVSSALGSVPPVSTVRRQTFVCPEMLLLVRVWLSSSAIPCCRMLRAREYTAVPPANPPLSLREQQPSNRGDIDSSVTRKVETVYYMGKQLLT
jgi:hypothetical protein